MSVWSILLVEVYDDHVEVERVALAADRYYMRHDNGCHTPKLEYYDNEVSPMSFRSAGALVGPTWRYEHKAGNVALDTYNQAYLDRIKATPMPFEHNASLEVKDYKVRLAFNNIRNHIVNAYHFEIKLIEIDPSGSETQLKKHMYNAQSIFSPTLKRYDLPLSTVNELRYGYDYRIEITPRDTALGMHPENMLRVSFKLEDLEQQGTYQISS